MTPIKPQDPNTETPAAIRPELTLPCGCRVEMHNHHGIKVKYCQRHTTFVFSPRHNGSDVFYFVTEEQQP